MELLKLTSFQETLHETMCGPASLKIVLNYYNIEKTERELAELMGKTEDGTDEKGFAKAAEDLGLDIEIQNESSFADIQKWIDKSIPVIVDWFTRGRADYSDSEIADGHYSVVAGLDEKFIYLQDPEIGGIREMGKDDFMKVWFDFSGKYISPNELIIRQLIAVYPKSRKD